MEELERLQDLLHKCTREVPLYDGEGKICLLDMMPRLLPQDQTVDNRIAQVAGISYDSGNKTTEASQNLVKYLMAHGHNTPLESVVFTFYAEMPGFVRDHIVRYRSMVFGILSLRYTTAELEKYYKVTQHPKSIRGQDAVNKQSGDQELSVSQITKILGVCEHMERNMAENFKLYQELIDIGLAREVARTYLPVGTYSKLFFTVNLRNLMHLLDQRLAPDAQAETQELARGILKLIEQVCPLATQQVLYNTKPTFTVEETAKMLKGIPVVYKSRSAQNEYDIRKSKLDDLLVLNNV